MTVKKKASGYNIICKYTRGAPYGVNCANEKNATYLGGTNQKRRVMGMCPHYLHKQITCPLYQPKEVKK